MRRRFPEQLETERLVLRRWREDDREAVVDIWADPDVWHAIGPGVMGMRFDVDYAAGRFEHHIDHWEQYGFGLWLAMSGLAARSRAGLGLLTQRTYQSSPAWWRSGGRCGDPFGAWGWPVRGPLLR